MGKFKNIYLCTRKHKKNLFNKQTSLSIKSVLSTIIEVLTEENCNFYFDISCKEFLDKKIRFKQKKLLNKNYDLIIVIGGDGSLLQVIRDNLDVPAPILGINKGRLGFLADLNTDTIAQDLQKILNGAFVKEKRSLLQAKIIRGYKELIYTAVNDIVLYNGKIPKLIEFQIFIDKQFMLQQRADGLVIATPTGSTAYSLSAGGPILYPNLKLITLIALYPHSLKTRPIVISENSVIELKIINIDLNVEYGLNFDGQNNLPLQPQDQITITKSPNNFCLIHPKDYNYFSILREKLCWD